MKARLYVGTTLVGVADVSGVPLYGRKDGRPVMAGDRITVALHDEHPKPESKPLFLSGLLETA